ncbi:hypothetical protein [Leptospira noguchii]|nr:hypothetical protein [Leptospira noguchii]
MYSGRDYNSPQIRTKADVDLNEGYAYGDNYASEDQPMQYVTLREQFQWAKSSNETKEILLRVITEKMQMVEYLRDGMEYHKKEISN